MASEKWDWTEKTTQFEPEPPIEISPKVYQTSGFVFFWKNEAIYSQWHKSSFEVDGVEYCCAEQYMMVGKAKLFGDEHTLNQIMATKDPGKQKKLGRQVQGFNAKTWDENCEEIVTQASIAK